MKHNRIIIKHCKNCKKEITVFSDHQIFCSAACRTAYLEKKKVKQVAKSLVRTEQQKKYSRNYYLNHKTDPAFMEARRNNSHNFYLAHKKTAKKVITKAHTYYELRKTAKAKELFKQETLATLEALKAFCAEMEKKLAKL